MLGTVFAALLPVGLLIAVGYGLRKTAFVQDSFWPQAERIGYYVLLPALFLQGLSSAKLGDLPVLGLASTVIAATLIVAVVMVMVRPWMRSIDGAAFTSVFQGSVRFNNYVGVTLAVGVFGTQGIALAAICNAAIVPTVNLLCVLVFARFGTTRMTATAVLRQIVTNPLILASLGGITLQILGVRLPMGIDPMLKALGAASLPLGLLCVGAALNFGGMKGWTRPVLAASTAKFVLMPLAAVLVVQLMGLNGPSAVVAMMFLALPTASSSYILARQLGGDAPLMAGITAAQTVLAAVMIPAAMAASTALMELGV